MKPETLLMAAIFGEKSTGPSDDDYHEAIDGISLREALFSLLDQISEKRRRNAPKFSQRVKDLMMYRYGFKGPRRTYQQLGEIFNVTRERTRQHDCKALRMLRHPSSSWLLKPFISDKPIATMEQVKQEWSGMLPKTRA